MTAIWLRRTGGCALRAITYDKDKQTYTVACTTAADDTTAQATPAADHYGRGVGKWPQRSTCVPGGLRCHDDRDSTGYGG